MKKIIAMLVTLMVTLFTVNVLAYTPPPSPAPASWISDSSHVLSDEAHARLDAKLRQINQSSANEIAALILPTLDGADIADVGDTTAKTWGVGKKGLDNGVLVVLAMKERKSRISTGKGVEGDLPDLKANDILQAARPYLRKGDVEGALAFIFDSSASAIANHKAEVAAGKTSGGTSNRPACDVSGGVGSTGGGGWILVLVAGGAAVFVWYLAAQAKRRREAEEAERQAARLRLEARKRLVEEREATRQRDEERKRQQALNKPTPVVNVPSVPRPTITPSVRPVVPRPEPKTPSVAPVAASVAAAATLAAAEEESRKHRAEEDRKRRQREQDEADRRRRQQEDDDRRRRDSESSYSSSSSSSSWSSGGWDSGGSSGGFGGGDSGGGGSSGDW